MHVDGNGARLRICGGLDEVNMAVQDAIGQGFGGDFDVLAGTDLGQLIFIHVGLDPDLAEVGDGEEGIAGVDVLTLRHLAIDDGAGCVGVERDVRRAVACGRLRSVS